MTSVVYLLVIVSYNYGMQNKKGFTLVEVLLVILLVGILLTSALTSYFDSAKTFNFLEAYKSVMQPIRAARSYSLANRDGGEVEKYGVRITEKCVAFLELKVGDDPFTLESEANSAKCKDDVPDFVNSDLSADFTDSDYIVGSPFSDEEELPIYMFYDTLSGDLTAYHNVTVDEKTSVSKKSSEGKDIWLSVSNTKDDDLEQFIVILTVSGLAEEATSLPEIEEFQGGGLTFPGGGLRLPGGSLIPGNGVRLPDGSLIPPANNGGGVLFPPGRTP